MEYIDKAAVVAKIETRYNECLKRAKIFNADYWNGKADAYRNMLVVLDTLEVIDPYERCVQYQSVKDGIKSHAETYSFNIDSELFPQLTKEQQKLWRKEIEYACISGGDAGYLLAKDPRYKENHGVKEVDLEHEVESYWFQCDMTWCRDAFSMTHIRSILSDISKHFFELGLSVSNKAQKGEEI